MIADAKMTTESEDCRTTSGRHYRWTDLSVLILSLLLAVSVATVVYMAVQPPKTTCTNSAVSSSQPQASEPSTETDVKIDFDGKKTSEKIAYNKGSNIMFFYGANGSFTAEDFDKGWVITNIGKTDSCVVIPTGNTQNRSFVSSIMRSYASRDVIQGKKEGSNIHAQILPGNIDDTSMFPDEANARCAGGYMWMTTTDLDDKNTFQVAERKKRAISGCYCAIPVQYEYVNSLGITHRLQFEICLRWCFDYTCNKRYLCSRALFTSWSSYVSNEG